MSIHLNLFQVSRETIIRRIGVGTHIVPLATVMFRLLKTGLGFDLDPYDLKACRTDTACCWRLHVVPSFMAFATLCPLPLKKEERLIRLCMRRKVCGSIIIWIKALPRFIGQTHLKWPQKHFTKLRRILYYSRKIRVKVRITLHTNDHSDDGRRL